MVSMQAMPLVLPVAIGLCLLLASVEGFDNADVCVSFKYRYSCAIRRTDGRVRCWHHNTGEVKYGPLDQQFRSISCKGSELCGVLHDGGLARTTDLWPKANGQPDDVTTRWDAWRSASVATDMGIGALSCDRTTTCYIVGGGYTSVHTTRGQLVCWGDRGTAFFESRFPDRYKAVAVSESVCLEEGSCSEEDYAGRQSPVCAIKLDGTLSCCCGTVTFMANIPQGKFVDVSVTDKHGCAVLEAGGVVCWGDGSNGKLLAPNVPSGSGGGGPEALSINKQGQIISSSLVFTDTVSNVDPSDIKFVSVTTTTDYSCGLLWNGVTVCWSFLTDTDLDLSGPGCRMESIASDGYVSCGRLMHGDDELVPSTEQRHSRLDETTVRTHTNTTFFGRSDTGVFCWQSFPDSLIGLERPTETWELDERRVPLDIRPSLETLSVCMGLPQREGNFDQTRIEALVIALALCTAIAFSAYRMVILKRFGDFSWSVTVGEHMVFWFGFIASLFDLVSQACFVFMDIMYISFRALFLEANEPYTTIVVLSAIELSLSFVLFLWTAWTYSKDEYGKIDLRSPMAIAKRRFLVSGAVLFVVDVPQMIIFGIYMRTMVTAGLRPSATAMFSALCCCVGPVYMVIKNYFRAKNAPTKPNLVTTKQPEGNNDFIFGDLAKAAGSPFGEGGIASHGGGGTRAKNAAKSRFLASKMFGKSIAAGSPSKNRIQPHGSSGALMGSYRRHNPVASQGASGRHGSGGGGNQAAVIAAMANKKTQARIKQLASTTTMKKQMATHSSRRRMDDRKGPRK